jgi:putative membrane protein
MMLDMEAFTNGALLFVGAFGAAILVVAVFMAIYQAVTPYNEMQLIRSGNSCAATTMGGALIGFSLPVAMSLSQASGWVEFLVWAALAAVLQIVAFMVVRLLLVKDLGPRIEKGEPSVAILLAAISITVGILNAASMTE